MGIHISHPIKDQFTNLDISFYNEYFPTVLIHLTTNAIKYKATTPKDQAIGNSLEERQRYPPLGMNGNKSKESNSTI